MNCEKLKEYFNEKNAFCKFIGVKIVEIEEGYARGELVVKPEHLNPINSVHGGCHFTLADTIGGTAASSYGNYVTTVDSSFHYVRPAINTTKLIVTSREIKRGKKLLVYDVSVCNQDEVLLSEGIFTYMNLGKSIDL